MHQDVVSRSYLSSVTESLPSRSRSADSNTPSGLTRFFCKQNHWHRTPIRHRTNQGVPCVSAMCRHNRVSCPSIRHKDEPVCGCATCWPDSRTWWTLFWKAWTATPPVNAVRYRNVSGIQRGIETNEYARYPNPPALRQRRTFSSNAWGPRSRKVHRSWSSRQQNCQFLSRWVTEDVTQIEDQKSGKQASQAACMLPRYCTKLLTGQTHLSRTPRDVSMEFNSALSIMPSSFTS